MARKSRKKQLKQEVLSASALYIRTAQYIRLSVEDNKNRGNSIETQKMVMDNYLEDKPEFKLHDTYTDNGFSGTNFVRPAFQKLLADIEAGKIDCVMVKDLSRLGRNSIDAGYYVEQFFPLYKVRFISVIDQYDSDQPNSLYGGIMLPLKNMINEAYSLDIGRKIKAQARQAMRNGEYVGGRAPYGYIKNPDNCHRLLVDEEAAAVVRQVFQWAYDKVGLNDIVKRLNAKGIIPPSNYKYSRGEISNINLVGSGVWHTRTVAKMLDTEIYTGDIVQGRFKTVNGRRVPDDAGNVISVPGTHEPIVSRVMFEAVKEYRHNVAVESKKHSVEQYSPNIFKGRIFCAHCGRSLHRQRAKRATMPDTYWLHCLTNSRVKKGSCEGVMMNELKLMPIVVDTLIFKLRHTLDEYAQVLHSEVKQQRRLDDMKATLEKVRIELQSKRRRIQQLYEDLAKGHIGEDDYNAQRAECEKDIFKLTSTEDELEKTIVLLEAILSRYHEIHRNLADLKYTRKLSPELLERLVERIEVTHEHDVTITTTFENITQEHSEVCKYE